MAKVQIIGEVDTPSINFTRKSIKWIEAIVSEHHQEVGFYCVVERNDNSFTITDVFYPKHELATGVTCEIDPAGMQQIMMFLLENGRDDDIQKLKAWGHSHVNMGVSPSGQDDTQAEELAKDNGDFLIRLIANKKGEMGITLYDLTRGLKFTDLDYSIIETNDEINNKVNLIRELVNSDLDASLLLNSIRVSVAPDPIKDSEYDVILEKVKKLKEVNIPKTTYAKGGYTNTKHGYSYNYRKGKTVNNKKNTTFKKDFNTDYKDQLDDETISYLDQYSNTEVYDDVFPELGEI